MPKSLFVVLLGIVACGGALEPERSGASPDASACLPRVAADGVRRCLPAGTEGAEYFRPALCGASVFDGSRPSSDEELCQWHGDVCACRPVRESERVYATELPPTSFGAAP